MMFILLLWAIPDKQAFVLKRTSNDCIVAYQQGSPIDTLCIYLDGPNLEDFRFGDRTIKLYWLIPIAKDEQLLKAKQGIESLERLFGKTDFNYLDPSRKVLYKYQSLSCQRSIAMM
ncbi:MAG: suppressor of fused domain protein [Bacteroidota bacterium]